MLCDGLHEEGRDVVRGLGLPRPVAPHELECLRIGGKRLDLGDGQLSDLMVLPAFKWVVGPSPGRRSENRSPLQILFRCACIDRETTIHDTRRNSA